MTNDSVLFLAAATIFGLAMLIVGWQARAIVEAGRYRPDPINWGHKVAGKWSDRDETDEAGA